MFPNKISDISELGPCGLSRHFLQITITSIANRMVLRIFIKARVTSWLWILPQIFLFVALLQVVAFHSCVRVIDLEGSQVISNSEYVQTRRGLVAPVSLLIVRAIGNSLPPRHSAEQSLVNLRFVLEKEEHFPNSRRHWFLNRIVDNETRGKLKDLLDEFHESYSEVPFNLSYYDSIPYAMENMPQVDMIHSSKYRKRSPSGKAMVDSSIQHGKIVYSISVNEVRNRMLEYGKQNSNADYILPWDGNCFLTRAAWDGIQRDINSNPRSRYFTVPMDRLQSSDNNDLLSTAYEPNAVDEPQILFSRKSQATFNPFFRYGRLNKIELLKRLRVPGKWDKWSYNEFDLKLINAYNGTNFTDLEGTTPTAGWVSRLSSGVQNTTLQERFEHRLQAVSNFLKRLDKKSAVELYGFGPLSRLVYTDELLSSLKEQTMSREFSKSLGGRARSAILPGSKQLQLDARAITSMHYNTTLLTLSYAIAGEESHLREALTLTRAWFIDSKTSLKVPIESLSKTHSILWISRMRHLPNFLDSIRFLESRGFVSQTDRDSVKIWFEKYLKWLANQTLISELKTHEALLVDVQATATSAYIGDVDTAVQTLHFCISRLLRQVDAKGNFLHEWSRCTSMLNCDENLYRTLHSWTIMAEMASRIGLNYWSHFPNMNGHSRLCLGMMENNPLTCKANKRCSKLSEHFESNAKDRKHLRKWEKLGVFTRKKCRQLYQERLLPKQTKSLDKTEQKASKMSLLRQLLPIW